MSPTQAKTNGNEASEIFPEEQIIGMLQENEAAAKAGELACNHGVQEGAIWAWKAKHME